MNINYSTTISGVLEPIGSVYIIFLRQVVLIVVRWNGTQ